MLKVDTLIHAFKSASPRHPSEKWIPIALSLLSLSLSPQTTLFCKTWHLGLQPAFSDTFSSRNRPCSLSFYATLYMNVSLWSLPLTSLSLQFHIQRHGLKSRIMGLKLQPVAARCQKQVHTTNPGAQVQSRSETGASTWQWSKEMVGSIQCI